MLASEYKLVIELLRENGARLGQMSVKIDWEPAREWTRFLGIRRGLLPLEESLRTTAIEPVWNRSMGEPYLEGFRVTISGKGCENISEDFSTAYFNNTARRASGHFVQTGSLKALDRFLYLVAAYPNHTGTQSSAKETEKPRFESEEVEPKISYEMKPLAESLEGAVPEGVLCTGDMPVFIPRQILDEAEACTVSAKGIETGGILIGHLCRDEKLPEIFAEVTAQIPARANGNTHKLTFSPETWTAVRAAVDIRNKAELYFGFWHSHPVSEWCKKNDCSMEKLQNCPLAKGFLSEDDQMMFRAVFPRAYSVALVCSDLPIGNPSHSLFGWRSGRIESRGFHVSKPAPHAPFGSPNDA
jgi:hypothetical protein